MTSARRTRALAVSLLLLALAVAADAQAQAIGPWFLGIPYGTTAPGDPLSEETRFDIFYPAASCPIVFGCSSPVMPVAVLVHGGNSNAPLSGPAQLTELPLQLLAAGFVVVIPSFHVLDLDAGESYLNATDDLARLIQFLRHYHAIVNIDPGRVFALGHSAGGFHSLFLGLNVDFQDLSSSDAIAHQSSRPDYLIPWGAPSDWPCFDFVNAANQIMSLLVFGVPNAALVPLAEKQAQSPTWWLAHPALYGRTTTPPMLLVYNLSAVSPCGAITDVHDGGFGVLLDSGIDRLCLTSGAGQAVCTESALITSTDPAAATQAVVAWMVARAW